MHVKRVKQILSSPATVNVEYHGVPIWITNCNEQNETAEIHDIDNPNEQVEVPIQELQEK
ncbi:H-type small acid-soluble spore protein [Ectobacillus polymachus]|uniref:H-type small acid-soluble spore protein n=1 Tax=Ectobacillus polymachus TaxID=1508806 RepID=UPI003A8B2FC5